MDCPNCESEDVPVEKGYHYGTVYDMCGLCGSALERRGHVAEAA